MITDKVIDVERRRREEFAVGHAVFQGLGEDQGSRLVINFQNEDLVTIKDDESIATVSDLICVLDTETGTTITTERLRYGQ
jgi:DUF917 family protein